MVALSDAGLAGDDPAMMRAARWLLGEEVTVRGDWSVARPALAPGGWAFEFANVNYPDVDDTAEVVLALERLSGLPIAGLEGARTRAIDVDRGDAELRRRLGRLRRGQHPRARPRAARSSTSAR